MSISSEPGILILAGGGHTHALMLKKWIEKPKLKPDDLIILISKNSTTLYSSMVPGLIAGIYRKEDLEINIRDLCYKAKISFVQDEVIGIDTEKRLLVTKNRGPLSFTRVSINLGSVTRPSNSIQTLHQNIKPLEEAITWLEKQDLENKKNMCQALTVIGSGLAAVEIVLALRKRWKNRHLQLQTKKECNAIYPFMKELKKANIYLISEEKHIVGPALRCTGSRPPAWLSQSGLPINREGRIITNSSLQVLNHPNLFATGDCAVIQKDPRPASGVWAVRAADFLTKNIKRQVENRLLLQWKPQRHALQLVGGFNIAGEPIAWALKNNYSFGPNKLIWNWKKLIDIRFIAMLQMQQMIKVQQNMECRGCAAKLPAQSLERALKQAGLASYGEKPEDAVQLDQYWSQSVDGFPALISDPWLNARITTLHACSDLWACGQKVHSAQIVITLPAVPSNHQEWLMSQSLQGVQSALNQQNASLLGGHTLVARDQSPSTPGMGMQLTIIVNGKKRSEDRFWKKGELQKGDSLLISRALGTGVMLAASAAGATQSQHLDKALDQMTRSQHKIVEQLIEYDRHHPSCIHACTDITGFGLLGHLGEMLRSNNTEVSINLFTDSIPSLPGSLELLARGYCSTLAPSNRNSWTLLDHNDERPPKVSLLPSSIRSGIHNKQAILELLVDPQTCGPLLLSCDQSSAKILCQQASWKKIGEVK